MLRPVLDLQITGIFLHSRKSAGIVELSSKPTTLLTVLFSICSTHLCSTTSNELTTLLRSAHFRSAQLLLSLFNYGLINYGSINISEYKYVWRQKGYSFLPPSCFFLPSPLFHHHIIFVVFHFSGWPISLTIIPSSSPADHDSTRMYLPHLRLLLLCPYE